MKRDWDERARRNAEWFINTVSERQTEREFDRSGREEVKRLIRPDLRLLTQGRKARRLRLLEIGCGVGRMTRSLARIFGEVHATDVSGEMIERGRRRLRDLPNVVLAETNGLDFRSFPDGFFDVIFCAFVYQHVPTADAIRANLTDAFRVLRPGGVFKFQTNSVENEAFRQLPKDTWTGQAFGEAEVRSLASRLGAQMISVTGAGGQYCWSLWRRPAREAEPVRGVLSAPKVRRASGRWHSLVIAGLDANTADVDNVTVQLDDASIQPRQVFPPAGHRWTPERLCIAFELPEHVSPGRHALRVRDRAGAVSPPAFLKVVARHESPRIALVTNGADGGLDVEWTGPKSHVRLFVEHMTAWPRWEWLEVLLGDLRLAPERISFVPGNGLHMVELAIPIMRRRRVAVALVLGNRRSNRVVVRVRRER
jgi:ubiquinone/menaquinone biosynthesis C-methylase UbiE